MQTRPHVPAAPSLDLATASAVVQGRPELARPGRARAPEHSGFLVVRLDAGADVAGEGRGRDDAKRQEQLRAESLRAAAERLGLEGLRALLDEYDLDRSTRIVQRRTPAEVRRIEQEAMTSRLAPRHSLTAYWRIDVRGREARIDEIVKRLNALPEVDTAYRELAASDPVVNAADDDYNAGQGYLDAAPDGIGARWAWTQPNGEGAGITVVDLEQGWIPTHEDLAPRAPILLSGDNRHGVGAYVGNHGTAVLGELCAVDNTVGVVGIAPSVAAVRMASHFDLATGTTGHVADAIVDCLPSLAPGDVLLLEIQRNLLPTEVDDADFDAIRLAVARGIVVVEAAGNGGEDLDAFTNGAGRQILDRTHPDFRDSGAIMCGASTSAAPHERMGFSNFGTRIDCYAWGENVTTCGYGDLDDGGGDANRRYTDTFNGTSSASPIVTGAALVVQGMYAAATGTRLSPMQLRTILANPATGTPQGTTVAGAIGVMPDLEAIVTDVLGIAPDVYLRDSVGDTGIVPSTGAISASPDIILRPSPVADPVAAFGEGSGTENSSTLGFEAEAGQDNSIYVRIRNRGAADANGVRATIYWSPVATLVTPASWTLVGTTAPVNVPVGDTIVVAGPVTWPAAAIPGEGHYCFVGVLSHPSDPAPPTPPAMSWDDFRAMIRGQNNVTWRNFNVVDSIPDPGADPAVFAFHIAGAPDRARRFTLEVLQRFPRGAEVWLQLPLSLAARLRQQRQWNIEFDRERRYAMVRLPAQRLVSLGELVLPARALFPVRVHVHGAKGMERGGHGLAVRQLYEGEEVGRVTWQFAVRRDAPRRREPIHTPAYSPMIRELATRA